MCPRLHPFSVPSHSCNTRTPSCGCYNDGVEYISACLVLFWECTFDEAIVSATYNAQFLCVSSVMSFQSDPTVHGASPLLYIWFLLLNCEVKCRISPMFIYLSSSCFESQSRLNFFYFELSCFPTIVVIVAKPLSAIEKATAAMVTMHTMKKRHDGRNKRRRSDE